MTKAKGTYISLFSGCGGFDLGFHEIGYKCLGAYDIDPYAINVLRQNIGGPAHVQDLTEPGVLIDMQVSPDVVLSGSPCQGFSTIGKRELHDPRNNLILVGGQLAIDLGAKVFIAENVPGSIAGEHKKYWQQLQLLLKKAGYASKKVVYNTADIGMAQARKRVILYAWKSKRIKDFNTFISKRQSMTLAQCLAFEKDVDYKNHNLQYIDKATDDYKIARAIVPGQKLCDVRGGQRSVHTWDVPEVFGKISMEEEEVLIAIMKLRRQIRRRGHGDADPVAIGSLNKYLGKSCSLLINNLLKKKYIIQKDRYIDLSHTFNGKFKRLDLNGLSPTVDTRFGNYKYFLHPFEDRGFSVREAARIQGFPDSFFFEGPLAKQYEMIGNAVPPPLAKEIAKLVHQGLISKL